MRKVILALARSSLVAALCCSVSFAQTAETSRAGSVTRSNGVDSRLPQSPRELFKRGKDLYLQGHYAKALQALEQVNSDADLSETDAAQLKTLLEATRKKVDSLPGRHGVTARAQSPDPFGAPAANDATSMMAALKKEARRLADAAPAERKAAAAKWISIARAAFNQGDVDDAEQIAQLAAQIDAPFKATEDSPEKVLADIQEGRKQDAAWKNDKSSPQAKRNRSNYLLRRAQQAAQQGDSDSAQRFLADAEQIPVVPGVTDLKPAQVRQQLEGLSATAGQTTSRTMQTANRPTRNSGIEQVGFEEPAALAKNSKDSPESMRVKADKALRQAQLAEKQGHFKDAWRLAASAQKLEVEGGLKYRAGEERPSQYVAGLMQRMPDDPASLAIMEQEVAQTKAAANEDVEFAQAMIASAKEDMAKNDFQSAREKLEHVLDLKISSAKLGERPEALLDELNRRAGSSTTASRTKPRATDSARSSGSAQTAPRGMASANKAKALQLMAEAKAAMAAGDLETARAKTLAANQLKVAFDVLEEAPHQLMAQIDEAAMSTKGDGKMLADATAGNEENPFATETSPRTETAPRTAATGGRTGRRTSGLPSPAQKQRAIELLELSRAELKAGRIADAKRLALEANEIHTVYALFEDRPELVLADIELAEASTPAGPGTGRRATQNGNANDGIQVAEETRDPGLAKRQAVMLLKAARVDLQAGRLVQAEEKAVQAEKLDASYSEFEDKPTMVLKEVARATNLAATGTAMDAATSENPFDSSAPENTVAQAGGVEATVIDPNGATAADLVRDGKLAMRRGDRAAAYHLFLQAYQSGEQLPPRTKQQLEDFLQQLSPKSKTSLKNRDIELAGGSDEQTTGGEAANDPMPAEGAAPSALDRVDQQLAVKLDALRTQVMNSIFRADRAREKDPAEALKILDKAQLELENADLSKEQVAPLLRSVTRARELAQGSMAEQKSNLDQKNHNNTVKKQLADEVHTQIRVEQEFADLVQQFNDLLKQRRYAEAELIAKKARELDPENPSAEIMKWKAKFAMRNASNEELKDRKEEGFLGQLDSVEWSAIPFDDRNPIVYAKNWAELSNRRKKYGSPDNRTKTEEEKRIEKSLTRQVSMHFENEPLQSVINKLAVDSNINFRLDPQGLEEVQVDSTTPITIDVDGIQMKSALNLILEPLHLGYAIRDEVLKITSMDRQKGDLETRVYNVADLVIPIPNFANPSAMGSLNAGTSPAGNLGGAPFSVADKRQKPSGQAFAQVQDGFGAPASAGTSGIVGERRIPDGMRRASQADFDSLMELVQSVVEPSSWDEVGGPASVRPFETTLSLVIRQTQQAHEEIQDLLAQLRRLQDLQVSIEVRFVTVSDKFFERIGVDFDFNVQGTAPVNNVNSQFGDFLPPYGGGRVYTNAGATTGTTTTGSTTSGQTTSGQTTSGQTTSGSTQSINGGTGSAPFAAGPPRDLTRRGDYPKLGTIVGLERQLQFSNDLQIPFRQGSFDVGIPDFGSFKPDAGLSMGFAILSDIETFFFIQAAQGDSRSNILFAPKVTLFNGQLAQVEDNLRRPFVVGQTPVVGAFTVAFAPNVQIFTEGVTLLVTAVVSADRRYVRLSLVPDFRSITDVFTFTFSGTGGSAGGNTGGSTTGFQGNGGSIGQSGGGSGGSGGQTGGSIGSSGGQTSGGTTTSGQTTSGQTTSGQTTGGQTGNVVGSTPATQTVQQPVQEIISIQTSVSVPDGGTVLLGGIKRLKEGRNMAGVPILNKIPYISRLFKNSGVGRETDSLMMMVTPRIIIQEEEEELLGVPL